MHEINRKIQFTLEVVSVAFFITVFFYIAIILYTKQVEELALPSIQTSKTSNEVLAYSDQNKKVEIPIKLTIPAIHVNAAVEQVGLNPEGEMGTPSNYFQAGWFNLGPRPGEQGSAVIAGHFNGKEGENGVFANLYQITKGDKLYTDDSKGMSTFVVRDIKEYSPGYAEEVFSSGDSLAHLNLITCDGTWDSEKQSYGKRLVVFADLESSY